MRICELLSTEVSHDLFNGSPFRLRLEHDADEDGDAANKGETPEDDMTAKQNDDRRKELAHEESADP